MTSDARLNILVRGVRIKVARGEDLETILSGYVNLTEEEKDYIRDKINNEIE